MWIPLLFSFMGTLLGCGGEQSTQAGLDGFAKSIDGVVYALNPDPRETLNILRNAGPDGLAAVFRVHGGLINEVLDEKVIDNNKAQHLKDAIDFIAQQKDAIFSRLYWYTDFELAKQAAKKNGKCILSLRLLGKLNEEYSCANSRFFRTALYANQEVSNFLRENFILHWQSVRPVPKITIDMGDGRMVKRTITGNSIHYVLDAEGKIMDAIPGLYAPKDFIAALNNAIDSGQYPSLREYHAHRLRSIDFNWQRDFSTFASVPLLQPLPETITTEGFPAAVEAMPIAPTKMLVEKPVLAMTKLSGISDIENSMNDGVLEKIALARLGNAKLDEASKQLIQIQYADYIESQLTSAKNAIENPLMKMLQNFERSMAEDTVRNEYLLHRKIHQWFVQDEVSNDLDAFNDRVYAELFLSPNNDPWLGLIPEDTYCALTNGGVTQTQ